MRKRDFLIGGLYFLAVFAAYLWMLCPTVYWEDSGELIAAAHSLGIAHPPGHPLWVILGRIFSSPAFGRAAYKVNLLSAFFSSLTGLLIYFTVLVLLRSPPFEERSSANRPLSHAVVRLSALSGALGLSFSSTFWFYSEIAEVYTLLGFFCSVLLLLTFLRRAEGGPMLLIAFSYSLGLALTNNVIILALLPAFIYFLLAQGSIQPSNHQTIHPSIYPSILLAFLLGLSLYLHLPIRSRLNPFVDWGKPQTLGNLIALVTAKEFAPQFLSLSLAAPGGPLKGLIDYLVGLPRQFGYLGFGLGILGGIAVLARERKILLFLAAGILLNVGFAVLAGGGPDLPAYFVPSYVFFSVFVGVGAFELLRRLRGRVTSVLVPISILILSTSLHFGQNNQRREWEALDYSRDLAQTVGPKGVLFTENTVDCFLLWYLQAVENGFPDQLAIYTPLLGEDWYREELKLKGLDLPEEASVADLARWVSSSRPVYYTPGEHWLIDPEHLSPSGVAFKLGGPLNLENHSSLLQSYDYRRSGGKKTRRHYSLVHSHLGEYFHRRGEVEEAISEYERAAQIDAQNSRIHRNLGILYEEEGDVGKALKSYERAVDLGSTDHSLSLNLGVLYLKSGDIPQALSWLEKSVEVGETSKARYSLGICYLRLGNVSRAIEENERAIALGPEFPDAYNNLGICYYQVGDYERALQQFRKALELSPDYAQARYNLEMLREKMEEP